MIPTYEDLVRRFGLAFRPDKGGEEYDGHPGSYNLVSDVELHDGVVRAAFTEFEMGMPSAPLDPYAAALAVWRADGLIAAGDPGPPAFRAAYERWAGPPQALILEHEPPPMSDDTRALQ